MKVEIWSDIMCPFCYIGKRHFEHALNKFDNKTRIEIIWKSFQLDPSIPSEFLEKVNVYEYLSKRKGISIEHSIKIHDRVIDMAKNTGLDYHFEKAVVANSFKAHRMIQMANTKGLGDEAEERLFRAYFTEGKDFGNENILVELGKNIGLSEEDVNNSLSDEHFAEAVNHDVEEAGRLGINAVPFFVFNRRYAVSGAQPSEVFSETLSKSFGEWSEF